MWQNRSSLPTKQNNTRLFSCYPAPSLHSSAPPPSFVSHSVFLSLSLFLTSSPCILFRRGEIESWSLSGLVRLSQGERTCLPWPGAGGFSHLAEPFREMGRTVRVTRRSVPRLPGRADGPRCGLFCPSLFFLCFVFFFFFFSGECAENTMAWSEWVRAPGREKANAELWMLGLNPLYLREGLTALFQPRLLKTHPAIALFNPKRK